MTTRVADLPRGRRRWGDPFVWLVLLAWLWVNLCVALRYEPWRDVALSWLIARDLSLPELFAQLRYEGHPCLWFLCLMPFAKAGLPFPTIMGVSFALTAAGLWMFLRYANLGRLGKLCVTFSAAGLYYLPVVARSYALFSLLLMLLYRFYAARHERPVRYAVVLFLLCQTHLLVCGLCGMLMLQWAVETLKAARADRRLPRPALVSALIMLAAVAFLCWQVAGSLEQNQAVSLREMRSVPEVWHALLRALGEGGGELTGVDLFTQRSASWWLALLPFLAATLAALLLWLRRAPRSGWVFTATLLYQCALHAFVYTVSARHMVSLLWMLLFCVLLARDELAARAAERGDATDARLGRALTAAVLAVCLLSCTKVFPVMQWECGDEGVSSYAGEAARMIQTLPDDSVVLMDSEDYAASVWAYLGNDRLYNPLRDRFVGISYHEAASNSWCAHGGRLDEAVSRLRERWGVGGPLYFLCSPQVRENAEAMAEAASTRLSLVAWIAQGSYSNEAFLLYRVEDRKEISQIP